MGEQYSPIAQWLERWPYKPVIQVQLLVGGLWNETAQMILRHKKFPLVIIFRDPKENWDNIVKERIIEQIKQNGFDDFIVTEEIPEKEPTAP